MGKGDKKTRRGKINQGSYGKKRPKNSKSVASIPVNVLDEKAKKAPKAEVEKKVAKPKAAPKKVEADDKGSVKEEKPKTPRKKKTEE